jgi:hypothetical protein
MSAIDILIEPHRVTRVFLDCCGVAPDLADQRRIQRAIERSIALADADDEEQEALPSAAGRT